MALRVGVILVALFAIALFNIQGEKIMKPDVEVQFQDYIVKNNEDAMTLALRNRKSESGDSLKRGSEALFDWEEMEHDRREVRRSRGRGGRFRSSMGRGSGRYRSMGIRTRTRYRTYSGQNSGYKAAVLSGKVQPYRANFGNV